MTCRQRDLCIGVENQRRSPRAAAWIGGADRWPEATWVDLEAQLGVPSGMDSPAGLIGRHDTGTQGKRRSDWLGRREGWY